MGPPNHRPLERRPIAARELAIAGRAARRLAARGVSPDAISLAGLGFGVAAGVLLGATSILSEPWARLAWVLAAAAIQLRLVANLLDGMVAVEGGRASAAGELYNEVPDRVSDAATLIGLGYAAGGSDVLGYLAACAALFTAYVRAAGRVAGAPQDYSGPMAKQQRMFVATVVSIHCGLAPAAWQPAWGPGATWGLPAAALILIFVGSLATAARRLVRAARTLRKGREA
jgi:phosphatidylglycerophosphate synthase